MWDELGWRHSARVRGLGLVVAGVVLGLGLDSAPALAGAALEEEGGASPDAEVVAEADGLLAGWDEGRFFLRSADERFRLNVGGRVQPRYEYRRLPNEEDTSSFFLRRVRLDLRGHLFFADERLTFRIMPELARTATLRDGWINYAFDPALQVRVGQFAAPFQWHRYVSGNRHHFTERGVPSETFGFPSGYDIGVAVHGRNDADTFGYGLGVFDGAGRNVRDSNSTGHMASGRVTWAVLGTLPREETDYADSQHPQLSLGTGLQGANRNEIREWDLGRSDDANSRAHWLTATGDVSLRWRGFSFVTDGYLRRVWPDDDAVDAYTGWAYMFSAGYFLWPERVEVVGRYSQLMLDRRAGDTRETEWGVGLNLYHRGHQWKTQVNYFNHERDEGTEHIALVQHHILF